MLVGSAIYPFLITTLRIAIYLIWGAVLCVISRLALPTGLALLSFSRFAPFVSRVGILSACYLLLFKRGNPAKWLLISLWGIAGGMLFPVTILPDGPQLVAKVNPMTHALNAMRAALLWRRWSGATAAGHRTLLLFAIVLLPLSMLVFYWTLERTKATGNAFSPLIRTHSNGDLHMS